MLIAWTPVTLYELACALAFAVVLDRVLGEPPAMLHPVVFMGKYLGLIGCRIAPEDVGANPDWLRFWMGAGVWGVGFVACGALAVGLQNWATQLSLVVCASVLGAALKPMFAWRMLRAEVLAVEAALDGSLEAGRSRLSQLVSRDVTALAASEIREGAIESLAENFNDSVVAPLFWFVVLGLPGAVAYRFANTADAMWGYPGMRAGRNWRWAGKWAARADDVLSWLPARISAALLLIAAGQCSFGLMRRVRAESGRTPSPNSGWPMAAMALLLDVYLRKPGVYALNADADAPGPQHARRAEILCARAVFLCVVAGVAILSIAGSVA